MCIAKVKGFLLAPAQTFKKEAKSSFSDAFVYFLKIAVVFAVLFGVVAGFAVSFFPSSSAFNPVIFLTSAVTIYIFSIVGALLSGLWIHLWAYIFGARKGIEQTFKAVFYGFTPLALFSWIPFIGIIFGIWSVILEIIGLKTLHGMSTGRAVAALVVPLVIVIGILLAAFAFLAFYFLSLGGFPPVSGY